jgi:hypothetical protein
MEKKKIPENLEELLEESTELRATVFLAIIEKLKRELRLSWIDISKQLVNEHCPICSSFVRLHSGFCEKPISIGSGKCIHCGKSLEAFETELRLR